MKKFSIILINTIFLFILFIGCSKQNAVNHNLQTINPADWYPVYFLQSNGKVIWAWNGSIDYPYWTKAFTVTDSRYVLDNISFLDTRLYATAKKTTTSTTYGVLLDINYSGGNFYEIYSYSPYNANQDVGAGGGDPHNVYFCRYHSTTKQFYRYLRPTNTWQIVKPSTSACNAKRIDGDPWNIGTICSAPFINYSGSTAWYYDAYLGKNIQFTNLTGTWVDVAGWGEGALFIAPSSKTVSSITYSTRAVTRKTLNSSQYPIRVDIGYDQIGTAGIYQLYLLYGGTKFYYVSAEYEGELTLPATMKDVCADWYDLGK